MLESNKGEGKIDIIRNCCVCLDELYNNDHTKRFYCNHEFHIKCIMPWQKICPVCAKN